MINILISILNGIGVGIDILAFFYNLIMYFAFGLGKCVYFIGVILYKIIFVNSINFIFKVGLILQKILLPIIKNLLYICCNIILRFGNGITNLGYILLSIVYYLIGFIVDIINYGIAKLFDYHLILNFKTPYNTNSKR